MRRRSNIEKNVRKLVSRTNLKSEQLHKTIKEMVVSGDILTDQVCDLVKKVLTTADDTSDAIYEAINKIAGQGSVTDSLRGKLETLLDSEELSEDELAKEIKRFLDTAGMRRRAGAEGGPLAGRAESHAHPREFPGKLRQEHRAYAMEFGESDIDEFAEKLHGFLGSANITIDELRKGIDKFAASMHSGRQSASESHGSAGLGADLYDLAAGHELSDDDLKKRLKRILSTSPLETPENARLNDKWAKALDEELKAGGNIVKRYKKFENFREPVSGSVLMAVASFLKSRESGEVSHDNPRSHGAEQQGTEAEHPESEHSQFVS